MPDVLEDRQLMHYVIVIHRQFVDPCASTSQHLDTLCLHELSVCRYRNNCSVTVTSVVQGIICTYLYLWLRSEVQTNKCMG